MYSYVGVNMRRRNIVSRRVSVGRRPSASPVVGSFLAVCCGLCLLLLLRQRLPCRPAVSACLVTGSRVSFSYWAGRPSPAFLWCAAVSLCFGLVRRPCCDVGFCGSGGLFAKGLPGSDTDQQMRPAHRQFWSGSSLSNNCERCTLRHRRLRFGDNGPASTGHF